MRPCLAWPLVAFLLATCNGALPPMPLLPHATRVVVVAGPSNDTLAVLTDPVRVAALTTFVNARREGWEVPWAGVPIPQVSADFYTGAEFHGHVGAGPTFLEAQRAGSFASRRASAAELAEFAQLLGVPQARFTPSH
jgi:hypothetical protein